jgi:hypothetical protein
VVQEKDLGEPTRDLAAAATSLDPDASRKAD